MIIRALLKHCCTAGFALTATLAGSNGCANRFPADPLVSYSLEQIELKRSGTDAFASGQMRLRVENMTPGSLVIRQATFDLQLADHSLSGTAVMLPLVLSGGSSSELTVPFITRNDDAMIYLSGIGPDLKRYRLESATSVAGSAGSGSFTLRTQGVTQLAVRP